MPDSKFYHIFDNVLNDDQIEEVRHFISHKMLGLADTIYPPHYASCFDPILDIAGQCYDLSNKLYYEIWHHNNSSPTGDPGLYGWHADKDELIYSLYSLIKYPLCTTIYYLRADENLVGGELVVRDPETGEEIPIQAKQNRLILLGPGIYHNVNDYKGNRHSVMCNPWDRPLAYYEGV